MFDLLINYLYASLFNSFNIYVYSLFILNFITQSEKKNYILNLFFLRTSEN